MIFALRTFPYVSSAITVMSVAFRDSSLISEYLRWNRVRGRSWRNSQWWKTTPSGRLRSSTRRRPWRDRIVFLKKIQTNKYRYTDTNTLQSVHPNLSSSAASLQTGVRPQHQCTHRWPITSRDCMSLRCGAKFHMAMSLFLVPWQGTAGVCHVF